MKSSNYTIFDCGAYGNSLFDMTIPVYIFENHNQALPAWGTVCNEIRQPLNLITFDTHNDTRAPFNSIICGREENPDDGINNPYITQLLKGKRYKPNDFLFEDVFVISNIIKHDEHIKTAYDFGYLKTYVVIHRNHAEQFEAYDKSLGYDCTYYDSTQVDWESLYAVEKPLALDFDLDFFIRANIMKREFADNITPLIKKASVITIAREPKCFEMEKEDDDYNNQQALDELVYIIKQGLKQVCLYNLQKN